VPGQQGRVSGDEPSDATDGTITGRRGRVASAAPRGDTGGASRFFYVAKASRAEREAGLDHLPIRSGGELTDREDGSDGLKSPRAGAGRGGGRRNHHPTVKPVELMRYLIRLITPPGGIVLDPFIGSGTTHVAAKLEGFDSVGCDLSPEYVEIANARVDAVRGEQHQ
ncbi:MAG: site-specific DNA-methyltransferase, partial [Actinobacteria bacterium]|nr:site-specific DNA-methyltransferase [Actinomycetota bacterium]